MIKVFIVDDHKSVLDSFRNIVETEQDMEIVGSSSDAKSVVSLCKEVAPHLVLTDVSMEKSDSGITLTEKLKFEFPEIKVIVMSGFDEISYIPKAKEAGADAFLSKSESIESFVDMIRAVMNGEGSFPKTPQIPTAVGEAPFTERELEILRLLCHSYTRKEIADEMHIAEGTVKRHIENMLTKSNLKSTMELVIFVIGNGWISSKA